MFKKICIPITLSLLLMGCSNLTGKDAFFDEMKKFEVAVEQENWTELENYITKFKDLYDKEKWKVQLLGDEGEYETLEENIDHLIVSIQEKDILETKLTLATIKSLLNFIYSL